MGNAFFSQKNINTRKILKQELITNNEYAQYKNKRSD
jgi:hypothetical protein